MGGLSKHFRLITASTAKIHQNSTPPFFLIRQLSSSIFTSTSIDIYIAMPAEHRVIPTLPRGVHLAEPSHELWAQRIMVITALCGEEQATVSLD